MVVAEDDDEIGTDEEFGGLRTPDGGDIIAQPLNGRWPFLGEPLSPFGDLSTGADFMGLKGLQRLLAFGAGGGGDPANWAIEDLGP